MRILPTTFLLSTFALASCEASPDSASAAAPAEEPAPAAALETSEAAATDSSMAEADTSMNTNPAPAMSPTIPTDSVYALEATTLAGEAVRLDRYAGKVVLFVNVASKCGYTRQYEGLQALHEELGGEDFAIVGIPSNDFGGQEPGSAAEIAAFCTENYGVTFDMLAKVGTKEGDSPIFDALAGMTGERPGWNFCKYVVSPDGTDARFFSSGATPTGDEIRGAITAMRTN